jgi:nucleoside 2-deoxyribosyltransferase
MFVSTAIPRVYLAGPDVFLKNAPHVAEAKKRLCAEQGFEGVFPLDGEVESSKTLSPVQRARAISGVNEALIRGCDILVANCTPFRGVSMDVGTAFEIGYARALGRPVFGYTNVVASYKERVERSRSAGPLFAADTKGSAIEDFGLAENLMIAVAIAASGCDLVRTQVRRGRELVDLAGFARCLSLAKQTLRAAPAQGTYATSPAKRDRA